MKSESKEFHDRLLIALESDDEGTLSETLSDARTADIAESFELLRDEHRSLILFALPPNVAAEVVILLDEAVRGEVVEELDTQSLTEIVAELEPDDAADMLGEMEEAEAGEILEHLVDEKADKIEGLLEYDEETAGGIMTPNVVAVPADATVADAVELVREASPDDDLHEVFIVATNGKLLGTVALRQLVTSARHTKVIDMCDEDIVAVHVIDDQEAVVQAIRKYDAMEAAVVDDEGRLVGRITHDDLLDVAEEEAEEDLLRMAGTDAAEFETKSVFQAARIRLTWLLPCMLGMFVTASVLLIGRRQFDETFAVALFAFAPMIGAMGGNSGIQISTVIIRGFATGELGATKLLRAMLREGRIALALAPVCSALAWLLATLSQPLLTALGVIDTQSSHPEQLALAVGVAMFIAILLAAVIGISLPFLFRRIGVDPAIASGPLITTLNDVVSVSVYIFVAFAIQQTLSN